MRSRLLAVGLVAAVFCLLPAAAQADSGSITNVGLLGEDQIQATFSATSTGCSSSGSGYCGWFPFARAFPASESCHPDLGKAVYVGDGPDYPATVTNTDSFFISDRQPVKLCLYIYRPIDQNILVAETVYDPPEKSQPIASTPTRTTAPAPPAATAPAVAQSVSGSSPSSAASSPAPAAASLTRSSAVAHAKKALKAKYRGRYSTGVGRRVTCRLSTSLLARCAVAWAYGKHRYRGNVTVQSSGGSVINTVSVKRTKR